MRWLLALWVLLSGTALAVPVGGAGPDFMLRDLDGRAVRLSSLRGRVVVLEWTSPTCPFVARHYESGAMPSLASRYAAKGVAWLAVVNGRTHTEEQVRRWVSAVGLRRPLLMDPQGMLARQYGATNTPHVFVLDRKLRVAYQGAVDDDAYGRRPGKARSYLKEALDAVLSGKRVSVPKTPSYGCDVN